MRAVRANGQTAGIDLGRESARVVVLQSTPTGQRLLRSLSIVEIRPPASPGTVLKNIWKSVGRKTDGACCNLGPEAVIVQQLEFPPMQNDELHSALLLQAADLIPNLDSMQVDYQVLGTTRNSESGEEAIRVFLVAAPRSTIEERTQLFRSAGIEVLSVVPDGIALANAVVMLRPPQTGPVLVANIGRRGTTLSAVPPRDCVVAPLVRHIQAGTDILVQSENADPALRGARENWLREIDRSIQFISGKTGASPEEMLVVGDGAIHLDFLEWVSLNMHIPVSAWNPFTDIGRAPDGPSEELTEQYGTQSAVALGLALMGEEQG